MSFTASVRHSLAYLALCLFMLVFTAFAGRAADLPTVTLAVDQTSYVAGDDAIITVTMTAPKKDNRMFASALIYVSATAGLDLSTAVLSNYDCPGSSLSISKNIEIHVYMNLPTTEAQTCAFDVTVKVPHVGVTLYISDTWFTYIDMFYMPGGDFSASQAPFVNINVTAPSSNSMLSSLTTPAATFSFNAGTPTYDVKVDSTVAQVALTPTTAESHATVTVDGHSVISGHASDPINLGPTGKSIDVVVTAQDGMSKTTYTVNVARAAAKSHNANIAAVTASSGNLTPPRALNIDWSSGDLYVDNDVESVRFKVALADPSATLTVNGKATASDTDSDPVPLVVGRTDVPLIATAEDGTTRTSSSITVFRAGPADATLSDLYAAEAELAPEFSSDTTSYSGTVPFSVATLSLYAQSNDPAATVTVGTTTLTGGGTFKLSLAAGKNDVDVVVKAANGAATKTYKLAITRPAAKTQVVVQVTPPFPTQGKLGDIFKYGLSIVNAGSGTPAIGKLASYSAVRDSKSADICSVVDGGNEDDPFMFSFNAPGDCLIHVTSAESADYPPYQHDYHITVLANFKPSPLISFLSTPPAQAKIGQSYLVQVLSGAPKARPLHTGRAQASPPPDPVLSIAKASAAVCSLSDKTVTFTGAGSCEIDADTPETKTFAAAHASQIVMVETGHRDPTEDPVIPDVVHDQIATTQNFTAVQMNNVENRLFELHGDDVPVFDQQASLTVDGEALPINALAFAAVSPENKAEPGLAIDRIAPLDAAKPADAGLAFPYRFWTAGSISFGSDTPEDRTGSTFRGADLTAGMDITVATGLKLGVSIGRNGNRTEFDDAGSYTIARGYAGTIYGSWQAEPGLFVDGLVGYGTGTMDIHRYDVDADAMAISSRGYRSLFAAIGLMDEIKRGDWTFSPSVKLDASRTGLDAYTETGADAYDLDFASLSTTSLRASAEAKVSYAFRTEHGLLRPSASIGYRHEFSGGYDQRLGYVSDPGTVYDIAGEAAAESEFLLGLGISYQPDGRTAIDLAYSGAYSQTTRSNTIRAQVSRRF